MEPHPLSNPYLHRYPERLLLTMAPRDTPIENAEDLHVVSHTITTEKRTSTETSQTSDRLTRSLSLKNGELVL